jgi:tRNA pseudouridine38-40 synthase
MTYTQPDLKASPPRQRLALLVEYDGTSFNGFQSQGASSLRTVQDVLQVHLRDLAGEPDLELISSSRTDKGVHAAGLVCHVDTACPVPAGRLPQALNSRLPEDVALLAAAPAPLDFHARYQAVSKTYTYRYFLSGVRPVLLRNRSAHVHGPVDRAAMDRAIPYLVGTHDFYAFMDHNNNPKRSTIRTVESLELCHSDSLLTLTVRGSGFLYHMVRILAGTLLSVGQDKIAPEEIPAILKSRDRRLAGKTMPPQGLCLEQVHYPQDLFAKGGCT